MTTFRILIVDDEPMLRDIATLSLRRDPSLDVKAASSASEALAIAETWRPDLIMLDVVMPDTDGPGLLVRLREIPACRTIPVLFLTARARPEDAQRYAAMGVADVIAKPFNPATLAATVRRHLPGV